MAFLVIFGVGCATFSASYEVFVAEAFGCGEPGHD